MTMRGTWVFVAFLCLVPGQATAYTEFVQIEVGPDSLQGAPILSCKPVGADSISFELRPPPLEAARASGHKCALILWKEPVSEWKMHPAAPNHVRIAPSASAPMPSTPPQRSDPKSLVKNDKSDSSAISSAAPTSVPDLNVHDGPNRPTYVKGNLIHEMWREGDCAYVVNVSRADLDKATLRLVYDYGASVVAYEYLLEAFWKTRCLTKR